MQAHSTLQPYLACPEAILGMACGALGIHVILGIHGALHILHSRYRVKDFLRILDLPSQQTTRDYLTGPTSWRLGTGRGKLPALNTDWAYKHGKRGGGRGKGHPHVKACVLKEVLSKYYRNRWVKV